MTKNSFLFCTVTVCLFILPLTGQSQPKTKKHKEIPVEWIEGADFNFGKISRDKIVTHVFSFINKGSSPVLLKGAEASCRCTVTDYSPEPILPGEKGFVRVSFNPKHFSGKFSKTILVFTNISKQRIELHISGEVIKD